MSFSQGDPGANGDVGKLGAQGPFVSMIDISFLLRKSVHCPVNRS